MGRAAAVVLPLLVCAAAGAQPSAPPRSHIGESVPLYVTGDECLFCHRGRSSDTWPANPHARTVVAVEAAGDLAKRFPKDTTHILGAREPRRGLKQIGYGMFALLEPGGAGWDNAKFAARCAGCHATAVDARTRAFSSYSLDCFTCHGILGKEHARDTSKAWLAKKHVQQPRDIVALCGQCHFRGAKAESTGLPYPDNYVVGDELFADYRVDLNLADDPALNPGDRHVYRNARDVLQKGGAIACLSCHAIHPENALKHGALASGPICLDCHYDQGPWNNVKQYTVHSATCEY